MPGYIQEAHVAVGQPDFNRAYAGVSERSLNHPVGVYSAENKLFVVDTGNNRALLWNQIPFEHHAPADLVLGQQTFKGRDEGSGPDQMKEPIGVSSAAGKIFVADTGNNRILILCHFVAFMNIVKRHLNSSLLTISPPCTLEINPPQSNSHKNLLGSFER